MSKSKSLEQLNAHFMDSGGAGITSTATGEPVPERLGVGVCMNCPCGCDRELYVPFLVALDGSTVDPAMGAGWARSGRTLQDLTLTPSVLRMDPDGCNWHGYITRGHAVSC